MIHKKNLHNEHRTAPISLSLLFGLISCGFGALLMGCEREMLLEKPEPTIVIENYDGMPIVQEAGRQVLIVAEAQSVAGLQEIRVLVEGSTVEEEQPSGELSYRFEYTFTVPAQAQDGERYTLTLVLTDQDGREASSQPLIIEAGQPYSVIDVDIGGLAFKQVSGRINEDFTFGASENWLLHGIVSVEENSVLTIEAGTTVYFQTFAEEDRLSLLSIRRGSRIEAEGTREAPIVFTSDRSLTGNAARQDWGGLLIHGFAPTNQGPVVIEDGFRYGGSTPNDNSGTLRFVRIEYAGKGSFHGLQLFGVGAATQVEYVQIYECYNIAFRLKGGRVSLKHIAAINHGGYGIWAEHGWQGNGQFWLFQTHIANTLIPINYWNQARSIEMRNDAAFFDRMPVTTFRIANVTLIGNGYSEEGDFGTRRGVRIRRGAYGVLQNMIVTGFPSDAVRVEDLPLEALGQSMLLDNTHSYGNFANWEQEAASFFFESGQYNLQEEPVPGIAGDSFAGSLPSPFNPISLGAFFSPAPYIGAVDSGNDWTVGGSWFRDINGDFR